MNSVWLKELDEYTFQGVIPLFYNPSNWAHYSREYIFKRANCLRKESIYIMYQSKKKQLICRLTWGCFPMYFESKYLKWILSLNERTYNCKSVHKCTASLVLKLSLRNAGLNLRVCQECVSRGLPSMIREKWLKLSH